MRGAPVPRNKLGPGSLESLDGIDGTLIDAGWSLKYTKLAIAEDRSAIQPASYSTVITFLDF